MVPSDARCARFAFTIGLYEPLLPRHRAAQTGLSCSAFLRAPVLRPLPRRDRQRVHLRTGALPTWPSPRN